MSSSARKRREPSNSVCCVIFGIPCSWLKPVVNPQFSAASDFRPFSQRCRTFAHSAQDQGLTPLPFPPPGKPVEAIRPGDLQGGTLCDLLRKNEYRLATDHLRFATARPRSPDGRPVEHRHVDDADPDLLDASACTERITSAEGSISLRILSRPTGRTLRQICGEDVGAIQPHTRCLHSLVGCRCSCRNHHLLRSLFSRIRRTPCRREIPSLPLSRLRENRGGLPTCRTETSRNPASRRRASRRTRRTRLIQHFYRSATRLEWLSRQRCDLTVRFSTHGGEPPAIEREQFVAYVRRMPDTIRASASWQHRALLGRSLSRRSPAKSRLLHRSFFAYDLNLTQCFVFGSLCAAVRPLSPHLQQKQARRRPGTD